MPGHFIHVPGRRKFRTWVALPYAINRCSSRMTTGSAIDNYRMVIEVNTAKPRASLRATFGDVCIVVLQLKIVIEENTIEHDQIMRLIAGNHPRMFVDEAESWNKVNP